jgi:hypothetical protein
LTPFIFCYQGLAVSAIAKQRKPLGLMRTLKPPAPVEGLQAMPAAISDGNRSVVSRSNFLDGVRKKDPERLTQAGAKSDDCQ